MTDETRNNSYNGWKNYETWNVALWLDNEESSQRYWRDVTQECYDSAVAEKPFTRDERARFDLAKRLQEEIVESAPDLGASMWSDLLNAAMSEVDWLEIAESWLSDVDKSQEGGSDDAE